MLQVDDLVIIAAVVRERSRSRWIIARTAQTISGDKRPLDHQLSQWLSTLDRLVWLKFVSRASDGQYELTRSGEEAARKEVERLRSSIKQCAAELQLNYW